MALEHTHMIVFCGVFARIRNPAGHHGEGGSERLAGQRHLCGELQRRELPEASGRPGPATGEEVCHRPRGRTTPEPSRAGEDHSTNITILMFTPFTFFIVHTLPVIMSMIHLCTLFLKKKMSL